VTDDLVAEARALAEIAHAGHLRKGTELPYVEGHLEPVAVLVREAGGTEVQVAAALLHDAVEDGGGSAMLDHIRAELGDEVARIVEDLSDSKADTTAPGGLKEAWLPRKQRYLAGLGAKAVTSLQVSVADKAHNAGSLLEDYRRIGPEVWGRFNEPRPEYQLWYYAELADTFARRLPDAPLTAQLDETIAELTELVRADEPDIDERLAALRS